VSTASRAVAAVPAENLEWKTATGKATSTCHQSIRFEQKNCCGLRDYTAGDGRSAGEQDRVTASSTEFGIRRNLRRPRWLRPNHDNRRYRTADTIPLSRAGSSTYRPRQGLTTLLQPSTKLGSFGREDKELRYASMKSKKHLPVESDEGPVIPPKGGGRSNFIAGHLQQWLKHRQMPQQDNFHRCRKVRFSSSLPTGNPPAKDNR
jgi:hypothetical protein